LPLAIWNSQTTFTYFGSACGYTVGSGGSNVSDAREKINPQPLKTASSLKKILSVIPKYYKKVYYETNEKGEKTTPVPQEVKDEIYIGLIAQEVLPINPGCVSKWKNPNIPITDTDDGTRYGICYDDFIVHLIGAVQEQHKTLASATSALATQATTIADQQAQITALQQKLTDLSTLVQTLIPVNRLPK
jgi:uncharacterized coiled-coil protein SlyX